MPTRRPRHSTTPWESIRRTAFGLTPERPLRAALNEERRFVTPLFDMHYELELGIVLAGQMERHFDGCQYLAQPGDCWLCGIWEPHGYRVTTATSRALVLVIRPELLVELHTPELPGRRWFSPFSAPPAFRPHIAPVDRDVRTRRRQELLAWGGLFSAGLADTSPNGDLRRRLQLIDLLLILTNVWQAPTGPEGVGDDAAREARAHTRLGAAIELVFRRRGRVSAVEAARACHLSRNHFDRLFQHLIGLTFARFALRYRLGGAAQDLLTNHEPLKKIARDWAFTDASHLVHGFRQHFGCTPLEYRRRRAAAGMADAGAETTEVEAGTAAMPPNDVAWNSRFQSKSPLSAGRTSPL